MSPSTPICLTIAGSDPSSGAGIQADLKTFHSLGVYGTTVITALTAQSTQGVTGVQAVEADFLKQQLQALDDDLKVDALKLGMLGDENSIDVVRDFLKNTSAYKILDPVMVATSGDLLVAQKTVEAFKTKLLPLVDLVTPNQYEAEILCGFKIDSTEAVFKAAQFIQQHLGVKNVLIKGGHSSNHKLAQDYLLTPDNAIWLSSPKVNTKNTHGTGCTLSSAICSFSALGYPLMDAITLAKTYINQGFRLALEKQLEIGQGCGPLYHGPFPNDYRDFPETWFEGDLFAHVESAFKPYSHIGIYPVVDSLEWVEKLCNWGVKTIQLRIKQNENDLEATLKSAIQIAKNANATLFINDYWKLAIELGAEGIHLGQSDLETADIIAIQKAGLYLGVSTHSPFEVCRALKVKPSYIAVGPIFETTTKQMPFIPQGINNLSYWVNILKNNYPTVAIGGIFYQQHAQQLFNTKVNGIAIVRDLLQSAEPEVIIKKWQSAFREFHINSPSSRDTKEVFLPQLLPT